MRNGTCNNCLQNTEVSHTYPDKSGRREALCAPCLCYRGQVIADAQHAAVIYAEAECCPVPPAKLNGPSRSHWVRVYVSTVARVLEEQAAERILMVAFGEVA